MVEVIVIGFLLIFNVIQAIFWSRQNGILLDKLMSRNYHEYQASSIPRNTERPVKIPDLPEDLRTLQGFQL